MKKVGIALGLFALAVLVSSPAEARRYKGMPGYAQDSHGTWERSDNLFNDTDGDGVVNYYDSNNRDSSRW